MTSKPTTSGKPLTSGKPMTSTETTGAPAFSAANPGRRPVHPARVRGDDGDRGGVRRRAAVGRRTGGR